MMAGTRQFIAMSVLLASLPACAGSRPEPIDRERAIAIATAHVAAEFPQMPLPPAARPEWQSERAVGVSVSRGSTGLGRLGYGRGRQAKR